MYRAVHVIVRGHVQGVGFRAFVHEQAVAHSLDGWVRNLRDGTVETILAGRTDAVHAVVDQLKVGPRVAQVTAVDVQPFAGEVHPGFEVRATG